MTFSNSNPFNLLHYGHNLDMEAKFDPQCFEDLESLDSSVTSPAMERKDSFATSTYTPFTPTHSSTNPWVEETYSVTLSTNDDIAQHDGHMMNNHMERVIGSNNPFLQQHQFQWPRVDYGRNASKTPLLTTSATYDFTPEFDSSATTAYGNGSTFGHGTSVLPNTQPAAVMSPAIGLVPSLSTSPQVQPLKDWMNLAEQEMDANRLPNKRIRQTSPHRPLTPGFSRREGVRKKNARFDIPAGRSLLNIDQLIAQATAQGQDDDIKELKQQKRLLRNRQAALDSRQRKKKHTEELEKEQKIWHDHRGEFENKMDQLTQALDDTKLHNSQLQQQVAELTAQLHCVNHEKQAQLEEHTQETMLLRTRINHLKDEVMQRQHITPIHSSHHTEMFGDFTNDLDHLTVREWDDLIMEGIADDETEMPTAGFNVESAASTTTLVIGKPRVKDTSDAPIASGGFLLMLLLYGAFVASKSTSSNAPPMPGMSDELRQASAHVVDDILKGGVDTQPALTIVKATSRTHVQAVPSMAALAQPQAVKKVKASRHFHSSLASDNTESKLDILASNMLTPSKDALAEAAFSLTPAQYNSLTNNDFASHNSWDEETLRAMNERRKTLADNLRQMREQSGAGLEAEVYRRSLLWDTIPENVLQDFRRMVEENNKHDQEATN